MPVSTGPPAFAGGDKMRLSVQTPLLRCLTTAQRLPQRGNEKTATGESDEQRQAMADPLHRGACTHRPDQCADTPHQAHRSIDADKAAALEAAADDREHDRIDADEHTAP